MCELPSDLNTVIKQVAEKYTPVQRVQLNVFILDQKNEEELLNNISLILCNKLLAKLRKTKNMNV